ncbi:MAG: TPM domain-containing protein [Bacteroidota bacterium]
MSSQSQDFFTQAQKDQIVEAIRQAEKQTSGEIKVHIEQRCPQPDALERAKEVFALLNLDQTALKNGVLVYLSIEDRKFAILGDKGIHSVVPDNFWEYTKDTMRARFKQGDLTGGLCEGIRLAGEQLKNHFPYFQDDTNELSDDISFGS